MCIKVVPAYTTLLQLLYLLGLLLDVDVTNNNNHHSSMRDDILSTWLIITTPSGHTFIRVKDIVLFFNKYIHMLSYSVVSCLSLCLVCVISAQPKLVVIISIQNTQPVKQI